MKFKKIIFPIFFATLWIGLSEFVRNEFLFKYMWIQHYNSLGLVFPDGPLNGLVWGLWSLLFAIFVYIITRKFSLMQSIFLVWFSGFVLMWIALGNLGVLPFSLLWYSVPLSILETSIAVGIIKKISQKV
jgi:hypothetical protein